MPDYDTNSNACLAQNAHFHQLVSYAVTEGLHQRASCGGELQQELSIAQTTPTAPINNSDQTVSAALFSQSHFKFFKQMNLSISAQKGESSLIYN